MNPCILSRLMIPRIANGPAWKFIGNHQLSSVHTSPVTLHGDFYEPNYLDSLKPKIPLYDTVDIQIKGYDYVILEKFQALLHSLIQSMNIEVADAWPVRAQSLRVTRLKPKSASIDDEFKLKIYERVIQVENLASTSCSNLLELIQATVPPGVTCTVLEHNPDMDEARYVPDLSLKELQDELDQLGGSRNRPQK